MVWMTLRMTFKTGDFKGVSDYDFEGDFQGHFKRVLKGDLE